MLIHVPPDVRVLAMDVHKNTNSTGSLQPGSDSPVLDRLGTADESIRRLMARFRPTWSTGRGARQGSEQSWCVIRSVHAPLTGPQSSGRPPGVGPDGTPLSGQVNHYPGPGHIHPTDAVMESVHHVASRPWKYQNKVTTRSSPSISPLRAAGSATRAVSTASRSTQSHRGDCGSDKHRSR